MRGANPYRSPNRRTRPPRTPAFRAAGIVCGLLAGAVMVSPAPAEAQDGSSPESGTSDARTSVALLGQTLAGGILQAAGIPEAPTVGPARGTSASGGSAYGRRSGARVTAPSGEFSESAGSLFREASTLERGWRLVGGGPLLETGGDGAEPDAGAWLPHGTGSDEREDDEPPFLVELFDAREVMVWVRDVAERGKEARRILFGPRGIVRMGSVPDSDRPRIRLELTDTRPGARFVILTR